MMRGCPGHPKTLCLYSTTQHRFCASCTYPKLEASTGMNLDCIGHSRCPQECSRVSNPAGFMGITGNLYSLAHEKTEPPIHKPRNRSTKKRIADMKSCLDFYGRICVKRLLVLGIYGFSFWRTFIDRYLDAVSMIFVRCVTGRHGTLRSWILGILLCVNICIEFNEE